MDSRRFAGNQYGDSGSTANGLRKLCKVVDQAVTTPGRDVFALQSPAGVLHADAYWTTRESTAVAKTCFELVSEFG